MKKLILLLILVCFSVDSYAGWNVKQRSKCRTFSKKHVARASLFTGLTPWQRTASCGDAYAEVIRNCAFQKTFRGASNWWQQGAVYNNFCSRGHEISNLDYLLLPDYENNDFVEESRFSGNQSVFDEDSNSLKIENLTGIIKFNKGNGYYSNFRITVWLPNMDLDNEEIDEEIVQSKVLHQFEIRVTDKGVVFKGNLASSEFNRQFIITESDDEISVEFNSLSLNIPINSSISLDDIEIVFDGDGAPDTENNIKRYLDANVAFDVILFPNPTANNLNIDFTSPVDSNTSISLFDKSGNKVMDIYESSLSENEHKTFVVDISHLNSDTYFLLVICNDQKLVKQVLKQ